MNTAQDQQSRAAELRATIDRLDACAKAGKPWPFVPSTADICAVLDELDAARALPAGVEPVGYLIDWPDEPELGHYFAEEANDGARSQALHTAAQVQAMGRVPPGWQAVPVEPTKEMREAGYDAYGVDGCYQSMLAAAPRPPAAQEQGLLQQFLQAAKEASVERLNIPVECWCERCDMDKNWLTGRTRMALCPQCGNKRCPRATHHDNACTGSNEPGQRGSSWEHVQPSSASKPTP